MPHGCWIDLYESADLSGERRRVFGPSEIDSVIWLRFASSDAVSLHVGPKATVRLIQQDGTERRLMPNASGKGIAARAIVKIAIARAEAGETPDDQSRGGRPVVHREVGDPPAISSRRQRQRDDDSQIDDEPAPSGAGDDDSH